MKSGRAPHPLSSERAWAQSLVGRDWEIFWDSEETPSHHDGNDDDDDDQLHNKDENDATMGNVKESVSTTVTAEFSSTVAPHGNGIQVPSNTTGAAALQGDEANDQEEAEEVEEIEMEISDWYDGRILGYTASNQIFSIRFVGDDQVYTMKLTRPLVRPSARAWISRTKALFSVNKKNTSWEKSLPANTSTLEDEAHLKELRRNLPLQDTKDCSNNPEWSSAVSKFNEIQVLRQCVQEQIYLRSKLAPIVDTGEKDEDEPKEAYVDFLIKCLQKLDSCCGWYQNCWILYQQVLASNKPPPTALLEIDNLRKGCVEAGRDVLMKMISMDVTPSGMKRQPSSAPTGARRTKRRRVQRDLSHMPSSRPGHNAASTDDDDQSFDDLDDGEFFSGKGLSRFEKKIRTSTSMWFVVYSLDMLQNVIESIQEPIVRWIRQTEYILGERNESDDDESSDCKTSVEEKDDGDEKESDISMGDVQEKVYSYQDAKRTLDDASTHPVLQRFDLSSWSSKLSEKLLCIERFEEEAWMLLSRIADTAPTNSVQSDIILDRLTILKDQVNGSEPKLANVEPLASSPTSKLTKEVVEDAHMIRQWVVDLAQAENRRERVAFIQDIVARASNLPHIPSLPSETPGSVSTPKLATVFARVQDVSTKLFSNMQIINAYDQYLAESADSVTDSEKLQTLDGIDKALQKLRLIPVLSLVEEKLCVRKDLLEWVDEVKPFLNDTDRSRSFEELESYYKDLSSILAGTSAKRSKLTEGLTRIEAIEKQLRQFALNDADILSEGIVSRLQALYVQVDGWKERADSIITALRVHGNKIAGEPLASTKPSAMVDCKRMGDLLHEYGGFDVSIQHQYDIVQAAYHETVAWSNRLVDIIEKDNDLLLSISQCRHERPAGVLVDPARHSLDSIIEMLEWYSSIKPFMQQKSSDSQPSSMDLDLLVVDGVEVIQRYTNDQQDSNFRFETENLLKLMEASHKSQRSSKGITLSKIESTSTGRKVLQKILSKAFDDREGNPISFLRYVVWTIFAEDFVASVMSNKLKKRPTLEQAVAFSAKVPHDSNGYTSIQLTEGLTTAVETLKDLIQEAQIVEAEARKLTTPDKETFKGSIAKGLEIREYLLSLKQIKAKFAVPKSGGIGFILNNDLEKSVDLLVKDLSWLERTLAFPFLHTDDTEVLSSERIPWDKLVKLYEQIPVHVDGNSGDFPKLSLRVKELYEEADTWQREVSSSLSISIRGAKRRHAGSQEIDADGPDGHLRVSNRELDDLVQDPILHFVAIPRESAVRAVLDKAREFESLMSELLGRDFSGPAADKAPYPDASSLVGTNGEFHLYRLTGSRLFSCLKEHIEKIRCVSSDIPADTPSKDAFEWIKGCVEWIDMLNANVTEEAPFGVKDRLVIPADSAISLLHAGKALLLDISDDIRRILSNQHLITLSTNKQQEKLTVIVTKGGSHHSAGGTAIKWCSLIFDWLKSDVETYEAWVSQATDLVRSAHDILLQRLEMSKQGTMSQDKLNDCFMTSENLKSHLFKGRDSLVVAPRVDLVDQMTQKQSLLQEQIHRFISESNGALKMETAALSRYTDSRHIVLDRDELLDSLLVRRRLDMSIKRKPSTVVATEIREKARAKLEKVMIKGMRMMGMTTQGANDVVLHCAMRALEIESAAYFKFSEGGRAFAGEYAQKVNGIVKNVDPGVNPTLCAQVLVNDITVDRLFEMTPSQLANKGIREKRDEGGKATAKLTTVAGGSPQPVKPIRKTMRSLLASVTSNSKASSRAVSLKTEAIVNTTVSRISTPSVPPQAAKMSAVFCSDDSVSERSSPPSQGAYSSIGPLEIAAAVQAAQRTFPATQPPPPPPLLMSQAQSDPSHSAFGRRGEVRSISGRTMFSFETGRYSFRTPFFIEGDSYPDINSFLPDSISKLARLSSENFSSFLHDKYGKENWTVVLMRLSVREGQEDFKKFYKKFEKDNRLPSFQLEVGENSQLILVTPKFHKAAKELRMQMKKRDSSYAVLFTKQRFFS